MSDRPTPSPSRRQAARLAAVQAETAGTDKETVAAGDEVNPPAKAEPVKEAPKKGKK